MVTLWVQSTDKSHKNRRRRSNKKKKKKNETDRQMHASVKRRIQARQVQAHAGTQKEGGTREFPERHQKKYHKKKNGAKGGKKQEQEAMLPIHTQQAVR